MGVGCCKADADAGILMGTSEGKFDPTTTATRAEVSTMLRRFVELASPSDTAEDCARSKRGIDK